MSEQDTGHPHRCREGHRWQHTGPTAAACEIPAHDAELGGLPLVSSRDCPVCSGREELLTRDLHSHYCNICEGDWDHEGRCLEGPVACCPWCFPAADAAPAPGARRGPHFHFCPECTQNWQHDASCSAPLRAVLSDCSGCRELAAERTAGERAVEPSTAFSSSRARAARTQAVRAVRDLVRSAAVPASIAACAILAIPILLKVSSMLWSMTPHSVAPVSEQRPGESLPALTPAEKAPSAVTPPSPREPSGPTEFARPSEQGGERLAQETHSITAQTRLHRDGERRAQRPPGPVTPPPAASGTTDSARLSKPTGERMLAQETPSTAAQTRLQRDGERRVEQQRAPARTSPASEPDLQAKPAAPPITDRAAGVEDLRVAPPPSPSPRELIAETPSRTPDAPTPPSESGSRTPSPSRATAPTIPGAPQRGGAALDTPQGPPRFVRASRPPRDLPTWSAESPRWDRASISVLMRAVVEVRPSKRISAGPRTPVASGREPRELEPRPSRGFFIDELGHVVTSDQRLGGATSVEVTLYDGRVVEAAVVARDRLNDIAVVRLERRGLPSIALGDSGALAVGERVLAIGSGGGLDRAPTAATVLATGASTGGNLAVDLTPKPDGVGGPLLNRLGQAVGIVIDSAVSTGGTRPLTFAVPVDRVKSTVRNLMPGPIAELPGRAEVR